MRAWRRQQREEEATVDLTPMLDIVFILLIFFIVTSTLARPTQVVIDAPEASTGQPQPDEALRLSLSDNQQLFLNDQAIDRESLAFRLQAERLKAKGALPVVIRADQTVSHGAVVSLIDQVKAAGYQRVALETVQP